jgi:hypothetical protein
LSAAAILRQRSIVCNVPTTWLFGIYRADGCKTSIAQPTSRRSPSQRGVAVRAVQGKASRLVLRPQRLHGIADHLRTRRDIGQRPAVRATESKLAVRLSIDLVTLLVDGSVVPATEQGEIREHRGASVGPVANVMPLAER